MSLGMNQGGVLQANPPYIQFETRAVPKQKPAVEGGALYYVDTDYALVTSHGSKDTVEKVAVEWFDFLKDQVRQGRFPQQWLDAFKASYNAWKNDQELPVQGTPIKNWPVASPAEIKHCAALGIRAVEDLATANEELIGRLGMGGRSLCARAKDWVTSKSDTAPLISQLEASRQIQAGQEQQIRTLTERMQVLEMQLAQRPQIMQPGLGLVGVLPPLEDRLAAARDSAAEGMSDDEAIAESLQE